MKKRVDRLSVKRKRYYRITAVIIISFIVFQVVSNFNYLLYGREGNEDSANSESISYDEIVGVLDSNSRTKSYLLNYKMIHNTFLFMMI